eukprot:Nk52_evm12s254 gene=Nk52_evmTU12s254
MISFVDCLRTVLDILEQSRTPAARQWGGEDVHKGLQWISSAGVLWQRQQIAMRENPSLNPNQNGNGRGCVGSKRCLSSEDMQFVEKLFEIHGSACCDDKNLGINHFGWVEGSWEMVSSKEINDEIENCLCKNKSVFLKRILSNPFIVDDNVFDMALKSLVKPDIHNDYVWTTLKAADLGNWITCAAFQKVIRPCKPPLTKENNAPRLDDGLNYQTIQRLDEKLRLLSSEEGVGGASEAANKQQLWESLKALLDVCLTHQKDFAITIVLLYEEYLCQKNTIELPNFRNVERARANRDDDQTSKIAYQWLLKHWLFPLAHQRPEKVFSLDTSDAACNYVCGRSFRLCVAYVEFLLDTLYKSASNMRKGKAQQAELGSGFKSVFWYVIEKFHSLIEYSQTLENGIPMYKFCCSILLNQVLNDCTPTTQKRKARGNGRIVQEKSTLTREPLFQMNADVLDEFTHTEMQSLCSMYQRLKVIQGP